MDYDIPQEALDKIEAASAEVLVVTLTTCEGSPLRDAAMDKFDAAFNAVFGGGDAPNRDPA